MGATRRSTEFCPRLVLGEIPGMVTGTAACNLARVRALAPSNCSNRGKDLVSNARALVPPKSSDRSGCDIALWLPMVFPELTSSRLRTP
jgi:hypothetical protein